MMCLVQQVPVTLHLLCYNTVSLPLQSGMLTVYESGPLSLENSPVVCWNVKMTLWYPGC